MILLTSFIFIVKTSFASAPMPMTFIDTTNSKKEFKLNKKEFLEKYGKDDSSSALIKFFFQKRKLGAIGAFTNGPFASFFITAAVVAGSSNSNNDGRKAVLIASYAFLALTVTFLVLSIVMLIKHTRKELLMQLHNYNAGQAIPKKISESHLYKRILKGEKNHSVFHSHLFYS